MMLMKLLFKYFDDFDLMSSADLTTEDTDKNEWFLTDVYAIIAMTISKQFTIIRTTRICGKNEWF